jgi:hypothetical protein
MARLNTFVVGFILLRLRRNRSQDGATKEHFSRLPYSAALLEARAAKSCGAPGRD